MVLNQRVNRATVAGLSDMDTALPRPLSTCTVVGRLPPRSRMVRHGHLSETLDTYGYLVWEVDWENGPASFVELYGLTAPNGLPEAALVPAAERARGRENV